MPLPPLKILADANEYGQYYLQNYCNSHILTFDGIPVSFYPSYFKHAFHRDSSPTANDKKIFDFERAKRIDWIKAVLNDPSAELYKRTMNNGAIRRIALEPTTPYTVVIQMIRNSAFFVTAYVVDSASALSNMRSNPRWV